MTDKTSNNISIKGARVNNLKNVDLELPRGKFIVITGLQDQANHPWHLSTLYAEGQRRYVESLSTYARQFLGKMAKPECDYIKGLPQPSCHRTEGQYTQSAQYSRDIY